jgi:hypothetical protein
MEPRSPKRVVPPSYLTEYAETLLSYLCTLPVAASCSNIREPLRGVARRGLSFVAITRVTFYIAKIEKVARKRVGEYRYFESLHRKGLLRARDLNAYRRKVKIRIDYRINAGGSLLERPTVIEWR